MFLFLMKCPTSQHLVVFILVGFTVEWNEWVCCVVSQCAWDWLAL